MGWTIYKKMDTLKSNFIKNEFKGTLTNVEVVSVCDIDIKDADHHKQIYAVHHDTKGVKSGVVGYLRYGVDQDIMIKWYGEDSAPGLVAPSEKLLKMLDEPTTDNAKQWRDDCKNYLNPEVKKRMDVNRSSHLYSKSEKERIFRNIENKTNINNKGMEM